MSIDDRLLRILLIEDDEDDFLIVRDLLRQARYLTCQLDWISTYEEGLKAILTQQHDLILIDYRLGAESGLDLLRHTAGGTFRSPMILLTGQNDDTLDILAMEMGASDYLVKGEFDSALLARTIRYARDRALSMRALAESEQRYRLLFEANPEPMYIHHRDSHAILAVNQSALKLFGYSRIEFMQMTLIDFLVAHEKQRFLDIHTVVVPSIAKPDIDIWTMQCKDGREIKVQITAHDYLFNEQPSRLVLANDITDKLQARAEAQRQEKAFHQLMDDSRDALLVLDATGKVRYANTAATVLLCSSHEKLLHKEFTIPCPEDGLFEWTFTLQGVGDIEVEVQRSRTEWEGEVMQLLSLRDIRTRKQAESQLQLLKRSIEASYNGVAIADALAPDLPLIYVNPAFERITGYKATEILGKNCRFLHVNDPHQPALEELRLGLQEQRDVHTVLRNFRKDGTPFWNDLYIAPVRNENGIVSHFISVQNDISEQKRFESELARNASHDMLTGLPNRSLLEDRLLQACSFAKRHSHRIAVIVVDLDGFKPINDSMGHAAGDLVLVEVARRLNQQLRAGDTAARLGSDEFVMLLSDISRPDDVLLVAERLIMEVALPYYICGSELHITASAGISIGNNGEMEPMQLVRQANLAMYKAKQQGRNNYQWYTQDMNPKVNEYLALRNELQKAIEAEDFEINYQPQFDARTQKIIGMEAILRWRHAEKGLIPSSEFIPIAEDTGQILPLNQWVLENACRHIKELDALGLNCESVAVNVSPLQFQRADFVEIVDGILARTGLDASCLELELTETILLENAERAIQTMHRLKKLGVRLAIDDFGTGFSSLNYLKRLPIDKIKIDRSFIKEIISDQHDAAITQGIISMAHHLNLQVIAEGIETEPQFAFLKKSQCDAFQGHYFGKPMPLEQLKTFMQTRQKIPVLRSSHHEEDAVQTLLLLDDEENILRALSRVLRREGYRILIANCAQDAFELLAKHDVQVILSDQRMPEMSGTVFFSRVKDLYPDTIRIILSGYTDLKSVTDAINQGAIYKFLTKPWDDDQLRLDIKQAFQYFTKAREELS